MTPRPIWVMVAWAPPPWERPPELSRKVTPIDQQQYQQQQQQGRIIQQKNRNLQQRQLQPYREEDTLERTLISYTRQLQRRLHDLRLYLQEHGHPTPQRHENQQQPTQSRQQQQQQQPPYDPNDNQKHRQNNNNFDGGGGGGSGGTIPITRVYPHRPFKTVNILLLSA